MFVSFIFFDFGYIWLLKIELNFDIILLWVLLHDTTSVKKKSQHNFIRVVIFEQVTREGRKWVIGIYVI